MEDPKKLDRRKFPRIKFPCMIVIRDGSKKDDQNKRLLTHTENVSIGGVCVALKEDLKMFSAVKIELDLLDLENHICCNGKIVWSIKRVDKDENKPQLFDVGIEFSDIKEGDKSRLGIIIKSFDKKEGDAL